jgi:vacuolar-type H+-ATPase subunit H
VLGNEEAMHTIIDGIGHRNESIQEQCIWCIHDLSARNKGAAALVKRGGFVRLKILLYTDCRSESKVAAIRSLKHFLLGLDRVAGPDEELIRRLTELLRSDNESLQDACADILSRMIQQDYIDLFINVHGAQCCPQSDNWGYCDPFVKMMINGQEHQTPILRNTLCPVWNYECKFTISDKSDSLLVELYDWDNTGAEVLGQIELSCERLHELGTELGLYRVGRDLSEKAKFVKDDAENKSTNLVVEAERQSEESRKAANEEAEKVRDELLEEARFIGSDAKAEAKKIVDDAAAKAKEIINAAAGQPRTVEFRAEQQGAKIREAAKKKAAQVQKVWDESTKDIEDIPERIKLLKQQAESKYVRIRKEAGEEADRKLLMAKKEAFKLRVDAHDESERILSLKEGWHIVMERNRDQLTGEELMGFRGEVAGFDDNGKVTGPGGKKLEPAPTVLKINFEYCVNVNVDAIIYDQQWITPRLFELLALVR